MKRILALFLLGTFVVCAAEPPAAPPGQRIERRKRPGTPKEVAKPAEKTEVTYAGGDGSTQEKAVIIKGAKDSTIGIRAEYDWVAKKYPGYQRKGQSLHKVDGKSYDVLEIVTKDGKEVEVYFDITDFFGKF